MFTERKSKIAAAILIVGAACVNFGAWPFLPDSIAVQITFNGQAGNRMPKPVGLIAGFAFVLLISTLMVKRQTSEERLKNLLIAIVLLAANTVIVAANLFFF